MRPRRTACPVTCAPSGAGASGPQSMASIVSVSTFLSTEPIIYSQVRMAPAREPRPPQEGRLVSARPALTAPPGCPIAANWATATAEGGGKDCLGSHNNP